MLKQDCQIWIQSICETVDSYRRMIDQTVQQLTDEELHARPAPGINSVAILLRHLGGNLRSRWTDFLTTDGEKPDRDRDREFEDWDGDRASLTKHFDAGWHALQAAIDSLDAQTLTQQITIRGEQTSVPNALIRSLTHLTYHVGQITMTARQVHAGDWKWLTIAPGHSSQFNEATSGSAASRGVFGNGEENR